MQSLSKRIVKKLKIWYNLIQEDLVDSDFVDLVQRSGLLNDSDPTGLTKLQSFVDALNKQDWSVLPSIITRPQDQLEGAKAAFLPDSPTIILNRDWLSSQNTSDLDFAKVLTEQVSYFLATSLHQAETLEDSSKYEAAQSFANQLFAKYSDLEQVKSRQSTNPSCLISVKGIGENVKALITSRPAYVGEYQSIKVDHRWQTVALQQTYLDPIVLASDPGLRGKQSATVRLKNISPTSFQIRLDEISSRKQRHRPELVSFLVVESGDWQLPDGTRLSAGKFKTKDSFNNKREDQYFAAPFLQSPTLLTQIQSNRDSGWLNTRTRKINRSGFQLSVQQEEALNDNSHRPESVGWLAIDPGTSSTGLAPMQASTSALTATDQPSSFHFEAPFAESPALIAKLSSFRGKNPSNIRITDRNNHAFTALVKEEQSSDKETKHTVEKIAYLAFSTSADSLSAFPYHPAQDILPPAISLTKSDTSLENGDLIFHILFSEEVHGLSPDDITISGGTQVALEGTDGDCSYRLIIQPAADHPGAITISIPAGVVVDNASNCNQAASQSFQIDSVATSPNLVITDNTTGTALGDVSFTFNFSEAVFGFSADDISITGGSKGTFSGTDGDSSYSLIVTPDANSSGTITVDVPAAAALDAAGNSTSAQQATQAFDTESPTVVISDDTSGTATGDVSFTFNFSEPVFGFSADDITITGGSKGTFSGTDGDSSYSLIVTPDANSSGTITVDVPAAAPLDAAGNSTSAQQATQAFDTASPTLVITDNTTGTARGDVSFTFNFSEPVFGFSADDISITGGSKGTFSGTDGDSSYSLIVTPDADSSGTITVDVPAAAALDAAGNSNTAATQSTQAFDTASPSVVISDDTSGTATGDVTFTFTFSEAVYGFTSDDITLSSGSKGTFSGTDGDSSYSLIVTPDANSSGTITVDVPAAAALDAAGNSNTAATQATQAFDTESPTVVISDDTSGTATGDVSFSFNFSEDVTGFTVDDITITGGSKGTFSGTDGDSSYSLIVTPDANSSGTITVDVPAAAALDAAGNSNAAATQATQAFDTASPSVVISDDTSGTATGDVTFTFTFSEAVYGFTSDDITLSSGSKGTFSGTDGDSSYSLIVTPDANSSGTITVDVPAAAALDAAGNSNTAATQATQAFDTESPTVVISDDTSGTATGDVSFSFNFSEDVTGFTVDDITITGGSKGTFSGTDGDSSYSLIVTPDANSSGTITVDVPAAAALDAAGNSNAAATQATQAFDTESPTVVISDDTSGIAAGDVSFSFSFSEAVTRLHG